MLCGRIEYKLEFYNTPIEQGIVPEREGLGPRNTTQNNRSFVHRFAFTKVQHGITKLQVGVTPVTPN